MTQLPLYSVEGKNVGEVAASEDVFGKEQNEHVVYSALCWFQASQRRGTHSTKTRSEVRGGGKKPWKQKGTGRARAGTIRSPLWRKGGVIFGPKPRSYGYTLPRKIKKLALKIAFSNKARESKLIVVEEFKLAKSKTKEAIKFLKGLGLSGKILLVPAKENELFTKAVRNIPRVKISLAKDVNVFDLLNTEWLVVEKSGVLQIEEVLSSVS